MEKKFKHFERLPALGLLPVFMLALGLTSVACNPEPPRQPAIKQKSNDTGNPAVDDLDSSAGGAPQPDSEGSAQKPPPEGEPAPDGEEGGGAEQNPPAPNSGGVDTGTPGVPGKEMGEGEPSPSPQEPTPPGENPQTGNPKDASVVYWTYFKPAEPNTPDKRHGSWNLNCLTLGNGAGAQIASPICNKKPSDGCYVFQDDNQGVAKSIGADLLDGSIEIGLDITRGGERCKGGEVASDDTFGFRYVEPNLTPTQAISYTSLTNDTDNRFKCAKKLENGKHIYKVCMEDNIPLYESDPSIWDFNDFVLILESTSEIKLMGLTCESDAGLFQLPEGRCK